MLSKSVNCNFVFTTGETYIVTWDGIDYECIAFDFNDVSAIGNLSVVDSINTSTGEPFLAYIENGHLEVYTETAGTHTFSIKHIPNRCIILVR